MQDRRTGAHVPRMAVESREMRREVVAAASAPPRDGGVAGIVFYHPPALARLPPRGCGGRSLSAGFRHPVPVVPHVSKVAQHSTERDDGADRVAPPEPGDGDAVGPVLIVTPWYGGNLGGVAVSVSGLVGALRRVGVPSVVYQLDVPNRWPAWRTGDHGETILSLGVRGPSAARGGIKQRLGYWQRRLTLLVTLARMVRRERITAIHLHYCVPEFDTVREVARALGVPLITTFRGSEIHQFADDPALGGPLRRIIRDAVAVTTVSDGLRRTLLERVPEAAEKAVVIRNAVPLAYWDRERDEPGTEGRDIDVLFCGNLLPVKGPDILLEAWRSVHARVPSARLVFVGSGPLEERLRALVAEWKLDGVVTFAGRVDRSDVASYYRRARIAVLPSRGEGLPLTALEATLVGTPVVGAAVGGVPEVLGDDESGILVPPENPSALADALVDLLVNEERRARLGRDARARTLLMFDPLAMARRYAALYATVSRR